MRGNLNPQKIILDIAANISIDAAFYLIYCCRKIKVKIFLYYRFTYIAPLRAYKPRYDGLC